VRNSLACVEVFAQRIGDQCERGFRFDAGRRFGDDRQQIVERGAVVELVEREHRASDQERRIVRCFRERFVQTFQRERAIVAFQPRDLGGDQRIIDVLGDRPCLCRRPRFGDRGLLEHRNRAAGGERKKQRCEQAKT
jgi:hypothetical protein